MRNAVGILLISRKTGKLLLLKRNGTGKHPYVWSLLSGEMEGNEAPMETLNREIQEEVQISPSLINANYIYSETSKALKFHYFNGFMDDEFIPKLDYTNEGDEEPENVAYGWFNHDELPSPLFPGLNEKIKDLWEH